jgi:hypothetical protein
MKKLSICKQDACVHLYGEYADRALAVLAVIALGAVAYQLSK